MLSVIIQYLSKHTQLLEISTPKNLQSICAKIVRAREIYHKLAQVLIYLRQRIKIWQKNTVLISPQSLTNKR